MKTEDIFTCTILTPPKAESENCLAIGTRLADFEITGVLGEGGFGIVYVAFDHSLQRTVAIKEYMPSSLAGRGPDGSISARSQRHKETFSAGLRSFINEARLLAQFDHPSLVKVYRFWEENKTAYMAMRYYEGQTLKSIVANNPKIITEAWLRFIFKQILEALDVLYKMKVLHRDISPDNIIIQKNGSAVLLDFGAARQIIGDMTQGLTVILKPGYAPIEQYADDSAMKQGPWTDIYSLSAVMYLAVVKTPPPSSVARMVSDPITPLAQGAHSRFSVKFLAAIDKGMAVQPEARPQTIAEFRKLLSIGTFMSQAPGMSAAATSDKVHQRSSKIDSDGAETHGKRSSNSGSTDTTKKVRPESVANPSVKPLALKRPAVMVGGALFIAAALGYALYPHQNTVTANATAATSEVSNKPELAMASAKSAQLLKPEIAPDKESIAWNTLSNNQGATTDQLSSFLQEYPNGPHVQQANLRLADLKSKTTITEKASTPAELVSTTDAVPSTTEPVTFTVKLAVKPWGTIFVDGKQKGVTPPLKKISLTEGKHKIRIVNPSSRTTYQKSIFPRKKTLTSNMIFPTHLKRVIPNRPDE